MKKILAAFAIFLIESSFYSFAQLHVPGGGTGTGANVTITDNGSTVTMNNGIISATITKASATITNYTFNGYNMLTGGNKGGQIYWSWNMPNYQNPAGCTYTLTANPAASSGNYAEIKLHMAWDGTAATAAMDVDVYYSLTRGAQGIYASAMLVHPAAYPANPGGEWRMASYVGSTFDWLSVDSLRNRKMATLADWTNGTTVTGAPVEVELLHTGIYQNQYECKYDYSADICDEDVWGWSSTTKNLGIWVTAPSTEYYNGGPMKRELNCHNGPTLLNMLNGEHYGMGNDMDLAAGETWQKVYGPFLIYCNSVPASTPNAWAALWADAKEQAAAEKTAWPYNWLTNPNFLKEAQRGKVTGKLVINDVSNPAASAGGMWIGLAATPPSTTGITDFQLWAKNYQFWVKTDGAGNFTIPHVLPGIYNMYAFGKGAAGQMTKLSFATVTAGTTTALGNVTWVPVRTAPTVWEIGVPDRNGMEFKHGTDWWTSNTLPSTHWAKFMDYPDEFPGGVDFTIGQSNIATDWNFVQNYDKSVQTAAPEWKIKFNLATAPTAGTNSAALYFAFASSNSSALIVKVNGTYINTTTGTVPANQVNAKIRKGIHGAFADMRLLFNGNLLKAGANEIILTMRITASTGDISYDYLRLEAAGTTLATTLPVDLQPLRLTKENNTSLLQWSTLSEQNNDHFEVQRAADGSAYTTLSTLTSKGNSSVKNDYSATDNIPLKGWNYYKIKVVDKDGKESFSNTVSADFSSRVGVLNIYPNPAVNNITVGFNAAKKGIINGTVTDSKGSLITTFSTNATKGYNAIQQSTTALPAGNYTITLDIAGERLTGKFIKL